MLGVQTVSYAGLLERFELAQQRRGLRRTTIKERDRLLRHFCVHVNPYIATAGDIEQWLDARNLTAKSRATYLSHLGPFFAWMVAEGERPDNPVDKITRPRLPRMLPRPAPDFDLHAGLAQASPRMRCWLLLIAYEGLRCFEVAALCREDILDGQNPPLLRLSDAKGGHQRVLPLNPLVLEALRAYGMPTRGPLFRFTHRRMGGAQITADAVSDLINYHLRKVAASSTAHQFRHSFGSTLYRETRDVFLVQTLMGHADPRSTAGYVAINPLESAVDAINALGCDS